MKTKIKDLQKAHESLLKENIELRIQKEKLLEAAKEMFDIIARKVHGGAAGKWDKAIAQAGDSL